MVCSEEELTAKEKVAELSCEPHNGQQLPSGHTVSLLCRGEVTASIENNSLLPLLEL